MQVTGTTSQLVLKATAEHVIAPEAVLGLCPVKLPCPGIAGHSQAHYHCLGLENGSSANWDQLLLDSTIEQYTDLCEHCSVGQHLEQHTDLSEHVLMRSFVEQYADLCGQSLGAFGAMCLSV